MSTSQSNRLSIATALLRLGDARGSGVAVSVLNDRNAGPSLRIAATELLAERPSATGRTALRVARDDADPQVRQAVRRLIRP